uniref:RING-type domain-containing protein n=1 Tax=Oryzias latipes TaxID=8090 RepID=A0A3B3H405_ORYLA
MPLKVFKSLYIFILNFKTEAGESERLWSEMAERAALLESYLKCHVCSETFNDPVTLSCNHNFCWSCLQKFWEQSQNKNCPICKSSKSLVAVLGGKKFAPLSVHYYLLYHRV